MNESISDTGIGIVLAPLALDEDLGVATGAETTDLFVMTSTSPTSNGE